MPSLKDLSKLNSTAEQIFVWSVLSPLVQSLLAPFMGELSQLVYLADPNVLISPAELADMVVRGHIGESDAEHEAAKQGIDSSRFQRMVNNTGEPIGPQEMAAALRRGLIPEASQGEGKASYEDGIKQSRLQNQWADVVKKMDLRWPGAETAIVAFVRSMLSHDEAYQLYQRLGGDPEHFQLEANIAGEGPTPVEAGVMATRGVIPWDGYGADIVSFQQAVSESRFKNKWEKPFRELAHYRPPPRTVTAMLREGSISREQAVQYLKDYGVPDAALDAYLTKSGNTGVQKAHTITESEIIRLYTERGINVAKCKELLSALRYSDADADLIIAAADLEYQSKLSAATIAAVKQLYLHRHIAVNDAITRLDGVGVKSTYRDALIQLWDLEIEAGVKSLTVKQILDMTSAGLFDTAAATLKLTQAGYSDTDAALLMAYNGLADSIPSSVAVGVNDPGPG